MSHDTLPAVFVHEYHVPPVTSWAFTVPAAAGLMVKVTASICVGTAFKVYATLLIA